MLSSGDIYGSFGLIGFLPNGMRMCLHGHAWFPGCINPSIAASRPELSKKGQKRMTVDSKGLRHRSSKRSSEEHCPEWRRHALRVGMVGEHDVQLRKHDVPWNR